LTTVFGNPGSTEQTFLKNFPDDFTYILGLQEASVLAMADGLAQSTGRPTLVNLHTSAGTGNAMGSLVAAYKGNTPLIATRARRGCAGGVHARLPGGPTAAGGPGVSVDTA
jgi:benzoylformate decarboxylase